MKTSLLFAFAFLCPVGCGTNSPPAVTTATISDVAAAFCAADLRCNATEYNNYWTSTADCIATYVYSWTPMLTLPGITQGELNQMYSEYTNIGCANGYPEIFPNGSLATGAPCSLGFQCVSGSCTNNNGGCGTCQGDPPGASCTPVDNCAPQLICIDGTCQAQRQNGESCTEFDECISETCSAGVCAPLPMFGEGVSCALVDACANNLVCNASNICAQPQYANPGQPCDASIVCKGGYCDTTKTCVAWTPTGAACDTTAATVPCRKQCVPTTDGGTAGFCDIPTVTGCN